MKNNKNVTHNGIEGIPFLPKDYVTFSYRMRSKGEKKSDYLKWGFKTAFKKSKIPSKFVFLVSAMRLDPTCNSGIGVKILHQDKISCWMDMSWFEKVKS